MKPRGLAAALIQGQIYDNPGDEPVWSWLVAFKVDFSGQFIVTSHNLGPQMVVIVREIPVTFREI